MPNKNFQKEIERYQKNIDTQKNHIKNLNEKITEIKTTIEKSERIINENTRKINKYKEDILLNAMIHGADFKVRHGMTGPYEYGYYATYIPNRSYLQNYSEQIKTSSGEWWKILPEKLREYLDNKKHWTLEQYQYIKAKTEIIISKLPKSYNPETYKQTDPYNHHVANGYETDGFSNILSGKCSGTYSSCTTTSQNELSRQLIVLRGYCADVNNFYTDINLNTSFWNLAKNIYKLNKMDYENISVNQETRKTKWAKNNPTKCLNTNQHYKNTR